MSKTYLPLNLVVVITMIERPSTEVGLWKKHTKPVEKVAKKSTKAFKYLAF